MLLNSRARLLRAAHSRHLRATAPKEVGPLIAGLGVAAMAYGAKLLVEGVQSGKVQETMKQAAEGVSKAASGAAAAASSAAASASAAAGSAAKQQPKQPTWKRASPQQQQQRAKEQQAGGQQQPSDLDAYFTTDVMGVELGEGATAWSGATVAILEAGAPKVIENEQGMRSTPSVVAFTDGGEVLVGQPAKKLLFSNRATPVSAHVLLLGLDADSPELQVLRDGGALGDLEVGAGVVRMGTTRP